MKLTPLKAIRKKCVDCSGYSVKEVRECVMPDCSLYPYRMGNNPSRKGQGRIKNIRNSDKAPTQLRVFDERKTEGTRKLSMKMARKTV